MQAAKLKIGSKFKVNKATYLVERLEGDYAICKVFRADGSQVNGTHVYNVVGLLPKDVISY